MPDLRAIEREENALTQLTLRCFKGNKTPIGTIENISGHGFNIYCAIEIARTGHEPQMEVPIARTQIDVLYDNIAVECKAVRTLSKTKAIHQLKQYKKGNYEVMLFVLKDTFISPEMEKLLSKEHVIVRRADVTKKEWLAIVNDQIQSKMEKGVV